MAGKMHYYHKFTPDEMRRREIAKIISPHSNLGTIGESRVIEKFLEYNIPVYSHFGFDQYVDLIAEFDNKLQRIQVKTSSQVSERGNIAFVLNAASPTTENGMRINKRLPYTKKEIDYFALYDFIFDKVYLVPVPDPPISSIILAEVDTVGNLKSPSYMRADYDFDMVIKKYIPIAAEYTIIEDVI